jgi:hypothetical protein
MRTYLTTYQPGVLRTASSQAVATARCYVQQPTIVFGVAALAMTASRFARIAFLATEF